jgi:prophage maintenance system killer protein
MKLELQRIVSELVKINKIFSSGAVVNRGSMEFAISAAYKSKDWMEQLAFIVRALLCDHVFEDGNKRTAVAYIIAVIEEFKYRYDPFQVDRMVMKIAKRNITSVKSIRGMIENAAAKNI